MTMVMALELVSVLGLGFLLDLIGIPFTLALLIRIEKGNVSTVEPLYNGHTRDWAKVTLISG